MLTKAEPKNLSVPAGNAEATSSWGKSFPTDLSAEIVGTIIGSACTSSVLEELLVTSDSERVILPKQV